MIDTLVISDLSPIGQGQDRTVYPHPDDPALCIKIANRAVADLEVAGIRDRLFLLMRGGRKEFLDYNFTDVQYARGLERRGEEQLFRHLPRCYGFVETDLGAGVVWERIVDHDGSPCISLRQYKLADRPLTPAEIRLLWNALQEFFSWQIRHAVLLREMAYSNLLVRRLAADQVRIYHIDAIGCADLIPLADHFTWFAKLRVRSKVRRFYKRMVGWLGPPPCHT